MLTSVTIRKHKNNVVFSPQIDLTISRNTTLLIIVIRFYFESYCFSLKRPFTSLSCDFISVHFTLNNFNDIFLSLSSNLFWKIFTCVIYDTTCIFFSDILIRMAGKCTAISTRSKDVRKFAGSSSPLDKRAPNFFYKSFNTAISQ